MTVDLSLAAAASFEEASHHPIVDALVSQRSDNHVGTKTVGPYAGDRTIYRLGRGHDHRGATWFDPRHRVLWLCGYARHRSGEADDAFPYFRDLLSKGVILPNAADYERLFADQGERFAETVLQDAQETLARACEAPDSAINASLGTSLPVTVVVHQVDELRETYVALSMGGVTLEQLLVTLAAFRPSAEFSEWELVGALPTRPLSADDGEICYRLLEMPR